MLRKISQAWDKVVRGGRELTKQNGDKETPFRQWLREKIRNTRLPYQSAIQVEEEPLDPMTNEELEELKAALSKSEDEKKRLRAEFERVLTENQNLREENLLKEKAIVSRNKRLKLEEESKLDARIYLKNAKEELKRCNAKINIALDDAHKWKGMWEESKIAERNACSLAERSKREFRIMMAELEDQMKGIRQDKEEIERVLRDYQEALRKEQDRSDCLKDHINYQEAVYRQLEAESACWEARYAELVQRLENHQVFIDLKNEGLYWKNKFSNLAWLANQAVAELPRRLKKADIAMHPLNTPTEVFEFVEFCKILTAEFKEKAVHPPKEKGENNGKLKAICN